MSGIAGVEYSAWERINPGTRNPSSGRYWAAQSVPLDNLLRYGRAFSQIKTAIDIGRRQGFVLIEPLLQSTRGRARPEV